MVPSIARDNLSLDSIDPICSEVKVGLRTYLMSSKEESEIHKKRDLYPNCVSVTYENYRKNYHQFSAYCVAQILGKEAA
jgi:hypothetical protein